MLTIEFSLKQHTAISHFEGNHYGATLRASEVKPLLDRFLIKKLVISSRDYFIGDSTALNYKLKIIQKGDKINKIDNPNYFGKGNVNVFRKSKVQCTITLFNSKIKEIFSKELLMEFFLLNNFGNRKSKGSGSFTLCNFNNNEISTDLNIKYLKRISLSNNEILKDVITINSINNDEIFYVIYYYWKWLKSGINNTYDDDSTESNKGQYNNSYLKSTLENISWEKKWLKTKFLGVQSDDMKNPTFARAILGLPNKFTFLDQSSFKKYSGITNAGLTYKVDIKVFNKNIKRIPSPITFKPIAKDSTTYIFILVNDDYKSWDIFDKEFTFQINSDTAAIPIQVEGEAKYFTKNSISKNTEISQKPEAKAFLKTYINPRNFYLNTPLFNKMIDLKSLIVGFNSLLKTEGFSIFRDKEEINLNQKIIEITEL